MLCLTPASCNWCDKSQFSADLFHSNIWPCDTSLQNLSDLEFDLLRSLKVKCDSVIELPIYAFLLMFNSNIWPNSAPLQDIRLRNLSNLEFDLIIRPKLRKNASAPNDPKMTLKAKRRKVPYIYEYATHESQISLRFALRSLVFQIIEVFNFSIGYNGEFEFKKKIVQNQKLKF